MTNEIFLLKNDDNRDIGDVERVEEFCSFLQGKLIKLSAKKAFEVIYHLQEHFPVIPDHIEMCWNCKRLYDSNEEGLYWETKGRHYCAGCSQLVPENYDKGRR